MMERFAVEFSESELLILRRLAKEQRRTVSSLIREAAEKYLLKLPERDAVQVKR
jgi:mRNA-degrading endonuclease RelE of RelBE toxin-antitoxin system